MKRIYLILVAFICIIAFLSACGGNNTTSTSPSDITTTTKNQENTTTSPDNIDIAHRVTVKFDPVGGDAVTSQTIAKNSYVKEPADPTRTGYTFLGWYLENEKWSFTENTVDGDITLTAKWTLTVYDISYELNGGINNSENTVSYTIEQSVVLNEPTKDDCVFLGWYTDSGLTNKITEIKQGESGNITLYAGWQANTYTITYELNSGINDPSNPSSYNFYDTITLQAPKKDGYMFAGWYTDAECTKPITEITGMKKSLTLYAKWATNVYNVNYVINGGVNSPSNPKLYTTGQQFTLNEPTKRGYAFLGWYLEDEFTTEVTEIKDTDNGDKVFYAKWEINTYTVNYVLSSGVNDPSNPLSVTVKDVISLKAPSREHYIFHGWYTDSACTIAVTEIKNTGENLTLYAKWTPISYNITYVLGGGTNNLNPETYNTEQKFILRTPYKTGYAFLGWYKDAEFTKQVTEIKQGEQGDKTFYAKWELNTYTVTYVLNGGVNDPSNPTSFTVNDIFSLKAPARERYYSFKGWYTDPEFTFYMSDIVRFSKDLTLYAKWEVNESYVTDPVGIMSRDYTIRLNSSLPNDTYTLKYENDDGVITKYEPIGELSVGKVFNKLVNVNIAPAEATKIGVYSSNGERAGSIKLYESFKLELGEKKYSFGALSDVHIGYKTSEEDFERALKYLSDIEKVKLIGISGDLTTRASEEQFTTFRNLISKYSKVPVYAIAGNHDTPEYGGSGVKELVEKYTGHPLYYSVTYGDDVFIMLGTAAEETGSHMPRGALQWLYETLEANKDKRCFLFTHVYPNNSSGDPYNIYGFDMWYGNEETIFMSMLNHYPNVTVFHGHSHVEFALQSLAKDAIIDVSGNYNSIHIPSLAAPRTGSMADGTIMGNLLYDESEGYVVDVYENGIVLRGYDFANGKFIPSAHYYIDTTLSFVEGGTYRDSLGIIVTKK